MNRIHTEKSGRKRRSQILLIAEILVLCAEVLALLAILMGDGKASDVQGGIAPEVPAIAIRVIPPHGSVSGPEVSLRYAAVRMTGRERLELAKIICLEAGNQCAEGQRAVAEVVLNRVISPEFPDTVHDVLHQGEDTTRPQFSTIGSLASAEPVAAQYAAIDAALYGPSILPEDVVFFSHKGENDRVWGKIQDHVFCYKYIWE